MSKIEDGGPAFPVPTGDPAFEPSHGMSLRDWFAGQALAGIVANATRMSAVAILSQDVGVESGLLTARIAYEYADAMLKERSK